MPSFMTVSEIPKMKRYEDATYFYYCIAAPGSALADASWLPVRVAKDGSTADVPSREVNGTRFIHKATDLATVQAIFA